MQFAQTNQSDQGIVPITEEHWKHILLNYMRTYRGPNADSKLKHELRDYMVLSRNGHVMPGHYIRYLSRGIVDVELRRGGIVAKCNSKTIYIQRTGMQKQIRVSREDNFIFVRLISAATTATPPLTAEPPLQSKPPRTKNMVIRMLAEEALRRDDEIKMAEELPQIRLKARFT